VAIVVLAVIFIVLLYRMARTVVPGWKYESWSGGKLIRVLDKPGFYLVGPFISARRVRNSSTVDRPK
jgi:regulator of protease activity HflC (stomatin/prohibitin superfamily)